MVTTLNSLKLKTTQEVSLQVLVQVTDINKILKIVARDLPEGLSNEDRADLVQETFTKIWGREAELGWPVRWDLMSLRWRLYRRAIRGVKKTLPTVPVTDDIPTPEDYEPVPFLDKQGAILRHVEAILKAYYDEAYYDDPERVARDMAILTLYYFKGKSQPEITAILGLRPLQVKVVLTTLWRLLSRTGAYTPPKMGRGYWPTKRCSMNWSPTRRLHQLFLEEAEAAGFSR